MHLYADPDRVVGNLALIFGMRHAVKNAENSNLKSNGDERDPLFVQSVEKAFRVLQTFNGSRYELSLSQIAQKTGLDVSGAQRFTYTLEKLGYLIKDPDNKRFRLSVKVLDSAYHYSKATPLIEKGMPYLLHLSKETEETVNLTVLDKTDIVFISRFMSRHVLNNDVTIGTRLPAYCTAPGISILSTLSQREIDLIIKSSELRPYTPHTLWSPEDIASKIELSRVKGYAVAVEEYFYGDISFAAPILGANGTAVGAINIAVSSSRYTVEEATLKFSGLVIAAARNISATGIF